MKIIYLSNFNEMSGFSEAARGYHKILKNIVTPYNLIVEGTRVSNIRNGIEKIPDEKYCILWHANPLVMINATRGMFNTQNAKFIADLFKNSKANIAINAWETSHLPTEHIKTYRQLGTKAVIVPSEYNKNIYKKHIKTYKVHHYIEKSKVKNVSFPLVKNKKYFLSISQWNYRKNFSDLLYSFFLEFFEEDIYLILKTYKDHVDEGRNFITQKIKSIKEKVEFSKKSESKCKIILITNYITEEKKHFLLQNCVAYCGTPLSEGFGIGFAEAAIYNKPVVAPNRGGQCDFLDPKYLFETYEDHYRGPLGYGYTPDMFVNYPVIKSIRNKLRSALCMQFEPTNSLQTRGEIYSTFMDIFEQERLLTYEKIGNNK